MTDLIEEARGFLGENGIGYRPAVELVRDLVAKAEQLQAEVTTTRKAVKFIIGCNNGAPWRDVLEADVDSYVDEIRKREAAEAAGGGQ